MKKAVIRKPASERFGIAFLTVIMAVAVVLFILYVDLEPKIYIWGLFIILAFLPLLIFLLYYLTWKIVVGKEEITKSVFFKTRKKYNYQDIKTVEVLDHPNMREYVRIKFRDGKKLRFRLKDKNSNKALKLLGKRFFIKDNVNRS